MFRLFRNLTLQIEPSNACNMNCRICMRLNLERPRRFLSLDNFKRILDSGSFRYVGLHGWGEPLLNPELFDMIRYAKLKNVSTNLTTNGMLVRENIDKILDSGLREIAFGVYDKKLVSRSMSQIEDLIVEKRKRGYGRPKTYLDITVYRENLKQITDLIKLAADLRVDAVILHRLFNVYRVDTSAKYISDDEEDDLFADINRIAGVLKLKLYLPPKHSYPCRIVNHCIFVTVDGKVTPCTYLPDLYIGDALKEGVEKTMRSKEYSDFVKNMKQHPVCSKCRW